jgi:intergrase/recombinase
MTMTDGADDRADLPKVVGTVGARIPGMVIRLGFSYLRHKKNTQKAYKTFVRTLQENGVPEEMAKELAKTYTSDISVRKLINPDGESLLGMFRS